MGLIPRAGWPRDPRAWRAAPGRQQATPPTMDGITATAA